MCLAHLSDNGYPLFRGSSNELGDNALATYQRGYNEHYYLNYVQRYYIKSSGAKGNEINQRLDIVDADSNWNFFYAGFSSSTKKVVFYIKGGYTGEIKLDI